MHVEMHLCEEDDYPRQYEYKKSCENVGKWVWMAVCEGYIDRTLAVEGFESGLSTLAREATTRLVEARDGGRLSADTACKDTLNYIQHRLRFPGLLSAPLADIYRACCPNSFEFAEDVLLKLEVLDLSRPDIQREAMNFLYAEVESTICSQ